MAETPQTQDAIALLKADHRKVEELFASFETARGADRKQKLVQQICTELTIHTILEEEIFYPACKGEIEEDLLSEAYVEHDGAKVLIAELLGSGPDEEFYDAKVKALSEQIGHHVEEEEKRSEGMFSQARKAGLDMDALADRMRAHRAALTAQFRAEGLPPPETRTFAGHDMVEGEVVEDETADRPAAATARAPTRRSPGSASRRAPAQAPTASTPTRSGIPSNGG